MSDASSGGGYNLKPAKKRAAAKKHPVEAKPYSGSPSSDVRTSGKNYGVKKANVFKKTAPYRGAVRAAYKAQPVAKRSAQSQRNLVRAGAYDIHDSGPKAKRPGLTPEQYYPLRQHVIDIGRNQLHALDQAKNDIFTGSERDRVHSFMSRPQLLLDDKPLNLDKLPSWYKGPRDNVYKGSVLDPRSGKLTDGIYNPKYGFASKGLPGVGDHGFDVVLNAAGKAVSAVGKGLDLLTNPNIIGPRPSENDPLQAAGILPGHFEGAAGHALASVSKKGVLAAGSGLMKGLAIPGQNVRNTIGNPLGIGGHDVSGAEIAQKLGLPKQTGMLVDFATDPVMWVGLGFTPESGGASLSTVLGRINKLAPEVLDSGKGAAAVKAFAEHGDSARLAKELRPLLTGGRFTLKRRTAVAEAMRAKNVDLVKGALAETPKTELRVPRRMLRHGLKRTYVTDTSQRLPDQHGIDAVTASIRAAHSRGKDPQLRMFLMTPFGRRLGPSIPITPNLAKIPYRRMSQAHYTDLLDAAGKRARADVHAQRTADLTKLDQRIAQARLENKAPKIHELEALRAKTIDHYATIEGQSVRAAEQAVGRRGLLTVGERVAMHNARKAMHAGKVGADEYGRIIQGNLNRAYEKALRPIEGKGRQASAERVRLYLEVEGDTSGVLTHALEDAIGPLTKDERIAVDNLRAVHKMEREHMVRTGLLQPQYANENYAGLRLYDHPENMRQAAASEARSFAGTTAPLHARSSAAFADISTPSALAQTLQRIATKPLSDEKAAAFARDLWDSGSMRAHAELLARDIARNGPRDYESLNKFERHAANYGATRGLDPSAEHPVPLFRTPLTHPDTTEGQVVLDNAKHYGFNPEELANLKPDQRALAKLYSLVQDRQHLDHLIRQAGLSGRHDVAQELTGMRERLSEQIKVADPGSQGADVAAQLDHAVNTQAIDEIAAHFDEQIGKIDAELSSLRSNADLNQFAGDLQANVAEHSTQTKGELKALNAAKKAYDDAELKLLKAHGTPDEAGALNDFQAAESHLAELDPSYHGSGKPMTEEDIAAMQWTRSHELNAVELKQRHFEIVKVDKQWVVKVDRVNGGTEAQQVAALNVVNAMEDGYKTKAEAAADLRAHLDDRVAPETLPSSGAEPLDQPAATAVDNTEQIASAVKARKALVDKKRRAIRKEEAKVEVQQAGVNLDEVPPGTLTTQLDAQGNLWLRGAEDGVAPPLEGMARHRLTRSHFEPGAKDDPYDYVGKLPDFRHTEGKSIMLRLDPRESGYLRAKGHGLASAWRARFHSIDEVAGRSAGEAEHTWHSADGEHSGKAKDLLPHYDDNGNIAYYSLRSDKKVQFASEDVIFDPHALLRSEGANPSYIDPRDGTIYYHTYDPVHGIPETMQRDSLAKDRIWPAPVLADFKREMAFGGELTHTNDKLVDEYRGLYDLGLQAGVQKYLSVARFGVTTPFPAYHVRNMISDLLKSLQADSGVLFHPIANFHLMRAAYGRGLSHELNVPGFGKMQMEDLLFMFDMFGVRTGHHVAEVSQILKQSASGAEITESRLMRAVHNSWFAPGGKSTKFGAKREDVVRFMTTLQRMRANGGDAADASWYMIRHHFNFNDLSMKQKQFMRNVFLFYTWYRKNIPLQLAELARRPGFFSGLGSFTKDLQAGQTPFNVGPFAGAAPNQPGLPDYVHDKLGALTTDWNGFALNVGFGAPWNDLEFLSTEGLNNMAILANPLISSIAQGATRQDLLTHRRYKDYESSGVATILDKLGFHVQHDEAGNALLPWAVSMLLRQVPILGRASYSIAGVSEARDQGALQTYGSLLGPITGLNIYVSPKPGSARERFAMESIAKGTVGERRTKLGDLSNLKHGTPDELNNPKLTDPTYRRKLKALDEAALAEWTRRLGSRKAALRYLQNVQQSGYYEGVGRGAVPGHSSGGLSGSGTSGLGGGGGL